MGIPSSQLEIWSHQGAVRTSSETYHAIRDALHDTNAAYSDMDFEVYLQGSYCNDTNIYAESDVDVVIQLNSTFHSNKKLLPQEQYEAHERDYGPATYRVEEFRQDVIDVLSHHFGRAFVEDGKKSVKLHANASRREADVVVCSQYRNYSYYFDRDLHDEIKGMVISNKGESVVNYPRLHAQALTRKHQGTNCFFKPLVRILKNIKTNMIEAGYIGEKTTASFYLEGWLYNAPSHCFVADYRECFLNVCNWLLSNDSSQFAMPHGVFPLIGPQNNQWDATSYIAFCDALIQYDKDWD